MIHLSIQSIITLSPVIAAQQDRAYEIQRLNAVRANNEVIVRNNQQIARNNAAIGTNYCIRWIMALVVLGVVIGVIAFTTTS